MINSGCGELTNEEYNCLNSVEKYFSDSDSRSHSSATQESPLKRRGRRRGKRGEALVRLGKQKSRMLLPGIFLVNVRSFRYKPMNCAASSTLGRIFVIHLFSVLLKLGWTQTSPTPL